MQFLKNNFYRKYFENRFGVPNEIMVRYDFYEHAQGVWAYSGEILNLNELEIIGVRALRKRKGIKPTTAFLRIIGKYAIENVVLLEYEEALRFLMGDRIKRNLSTEPGFVIVKFNKDVLGCGLHTDNELISQIPKKYRINGTWL